MLLRCRIWHLANQRRLPRKVDLYPARNLLDEPERSEVYDFNAASFKPESLTRRVLRKITKKR